MSDHKHYHHLVIDGRGHLLGRLASIVAKQVLNGQRLVCPSPFAPFCYFQFNCMDPSPLARAYSSLFHDPVTHLLSLAGRCALRWNQRLRLFLPQQAYAWTYLVLNF